MQDSYEALYGEHQVQLFSPICCYWWRFAQTNENIRIHIRNPNQDPRFLHQAPTLGLEALQPSRPEQVVVAISAST